MRVRFNVHRLSIRVEGRHDEGTRGIVCSRRDELRFVWGAIREQACRIDGVEAVFGVIHEYFQLADGGRVGKRQHEVRPAIAVWISAGPEAIPGTPVEVIDAADRTAKLADDQSRRFDWLAVT